MVLGPPRTSGSTCSICKGPPVTASGLWQYSQRERARSATVCRPVGEMYAIKGYGWQRGGFSARAPRCLRRKRALALRSVMKSSCSTNVAASSCSRAVSIRWCCALRRACRRRAVIGDRPHFPLSTPRHEGAILTCLTHARYAGSGVNRRSAWKTLRHDLGMSISASTM
jgi:hypothetical protein